MIKTLSKFALLAAVASLAVAGSMTTADAKKAKKAAAPAACTMPGYKTVACKGDPSLCATQRCGMDGKWYPAIPCIEPFCPPKG
ncbi:MAG: hypothetical protein HXY30_12600 [Pseudorhodoplanes sp.]|nr:hypothetical protein [Pseudorhodoplanes sp.]